MSHTTINKTLQLGLNQAVFRRQSNKGLNTMQQQFNTKYKPYEALKHGRNI